MIFEFLFCVKLVHDGCSSASKTHEQYVHIDYLYILLSISQIIATSHDLNPKKGRAGTKNLDISSEAFSSI